MLDLGEQRNVARKDADLALNRGNHDTINRVRVDLGFGSNDFESERHLGKGLSDK